jgi:hypothetical protein
MLLKIGNLDIVNGGNPPTKENVRLFLYRAIEKSEAIGLNLFVTGRVITDWKITYDFDITLIGEVKDYDKLEELFFDLYDYAFNKLNLNIDLRWTSELDNVELNDEKEIQFKNVDYIIFGYWEKQYSNKETSSIFDYSIHNQILRKGIFIPVSKWLVKSNYLKKELKYALWKPHQIEQIKTYSRFLSVPALEFLMNIDEYFKE